MTLPLELGAIEDGYTRRAFENIAQTYPIAPPNQLGGIPSGVATLPTAPSNGQDFYYAIGGGVWHFKYSVGSGKWDFAGGPPLFAEVTTDEATASTTYVALTTAGPSIALPFAGDYDVEIGAHMYTNASSQVAIMSYDIGGTGASDADQIAQRSGSTEGATHHAANARVRRKTGLTAVTLTAKYKTGGAGTADFFNRWMSVTPVRVG